MKEIPKKSKNKDLPNPPPALPEVKPILPLPVRKFFRDLLLADICLFLVFFAVTFIVYRLFDLSLPSEFESFFYSVSLWVAIISLFLYIPWKPRSLCYNCIHGSHHHSYLSINDPNKNVFLNPGFSRSYYNSRN